MSTTDSNYIFYFNPDSIVNTTSYQSASVHIALDKTISVLNLETFSNLINHEYNNGRKFSWSEIAIESLGESREIWLHFCLNCKIIQSIELMLVDYILPNTEIDNFLVLKIIISLICPNCKLFNEFSDVKVFFVIDDEPVKDKIRSRMKMSDEFIIKEIY